MVAVQFLEMRNLGHSGLSHPRSKTSAAKGNDTESAKAGGEVSLGQIGGRANEGRTECRVGRPTADEMAVR